MNPAVDAWKRFRALVDGLDWTWAYFAERMRYEPMSAKGAANYQQRLKNYYHRRSADLGEILRGMLHGLKLDPGEAAQFDPLCAHAWLPAQFEERGGPTLAPIPENDAFRALVRRIKFRVLQAAHGQDPQRPERVALDPSNPFRDVLPQGHPAAIAMDAKLQSEIRQAVVPSDPAMLRAALDDSRDRINAIESHRGPMGLAGLPGEAVTKQTAIDAKDSEFRSYLEQLPPAAGVNRRGGRTDDPAPYQRFGPVLAEYGLGSRSTSASRSPGLVVHCGATTLLPVAVFLSLARRFNLRLTIRFNYHNAQEQLASTADLKADALPDFLVSPHGPFYLAGGRRLERGIRSEYVQTLPITHIGRCVLQRPVEGNKEVSRRLWVPDGSSDLEQLLLDYPPRSKTKPLYKIVDPVIEFDLSRKTIPPGERIAVSDAVTSLLGPDGAGEEDLRGFEPVQDNGSEYMAPVWLFARRDRWDAKPTFRLAATWFAWEIAYLCKYPAWAATVLAEYCLAAGYCPLELGAKFAACMRLR